MTTIPQSYLPPDSQPWGRSVDQRIADNSSAISRAALDANNAQTQLQSSIQRLSSFYSVAEAISTSNTVGEPGTPSVYTQESFSSSIDPDVTITTNTGRVLVTVSAVGELNVPGTGQARAYLQPECVGVDTLTNTSPGLLVALAQFSGAQFLGFGNSFQRLYELPVGTYNFRFRRAVEKGGSSTGMSLVTSYRAITAQSIP